MLLKMIKPLRMKNILAQNICKKKKMIKYVILNTLKKPNKFLN